MIDDDALAVAVSAGLDAAPARLEIPLKRPATVTGGGLTPVAVVVDGDSATPVTTTAQNLTGVTLVVGDRVMVEYQPPHGVSVVGLIDAGIAARNPHTSLVRVVPTADRSAVSAVYVDMPGDSATSLSFTKLRADTVLVVDVASNGFYINATTGITYGYQVNAVDLDVVRTGVLINTRDTAVGWNRTTGLAAGVWTVKVRVKSDAGTMHWDTFSSTALKVTETF